MKNIALIIYSLKGGGAERVVSLLSHQLSKKYNLYLILFDSLDIAYSYGGKLIDINVKSQRSLIMKIINVVLRIYYIRKVKKKYNINVSISFQDGANITNLLSKTDEQVIISIRSFLSKREKNTINYLTIWLTKILYNKSDNIIANSKGVADDLIDTFNLNKTLIDCIYNPIDLKRVKQLTQEDLVEDDYIFKENMFTILNIGRLTKVKGQWHLIRAFSYVIKEISNIKLLILGQGELETYLKDLVLELNLQEHVTFLGFKKNIFKYARNSQVFVLSSLYEGFGNVIVEAMACGVPIISSDCKAGPREILAPNTDTKYETKDIEYAEYGVLVPVCDNILYGHKEPLTPEELLLGKGIVELVKNSELRKQYSIKGLRRVEDFSIEKIAKKWEGLID